MREWLGRADVAALGMAALGAWLAIEVYEAGRRAGEQNFFGGQMARFRSEMMGG